MEVLLSSAVKGAIADPEVVRLASIAETLKGDYLKSDDNDPWEGSPFAWIKTRPSRQVGKIGEQLVAGWCAARGLDVVGAGDSQADRVIGGRRMEIKFSTLWETGVYKFQQVRNQDWEFAACLGLSPFDAHLWVIPKDILWARATPQHGGKGGTDTRWLSFAAAPPPSWLGEWGGKLEDAWGRLTKVKR